MNHKKNSKLVVYKPLNFYWAQTLCTMYEISCQVEQIIIRLDSPKPLAPRNPNQSMVLSFPRIFCTWKKLYNNLSLSRGSARPAAVPHRMKLDCRGPFIFILFEIKKNKIYQTTGHASHRSCAPAAQQPAHGAYLFFSLKNILSHSYKLRFENRLHHSLLLDEPNKTRSHLHMF